MIIVNCLVPMTGPSLFSPASSADPVSSIITYHVLSPDVQRQLTLAQDQWPPALQLWRKFVARRESRKGCMPLKLIGFCQNLHELKVPKMLHGYNGKPCLATKSCTFRSSELPAVLELEIDVRSWAVICRQSIYSVMDRLPIANLLIGFVIEGTNEEDLPEQLLCCCGVRGLDFHAAFRHEDTVTDSRYEGIQRVSAPFNFEKTWMPSSLIEMTSISFSISLALCLSRVMLVFVCENIHSSPCVLFHQVR